MIDRLSLALLLAVLLLASALPAEGQVELFEFFTECAPVSLGVLVQDDGDEPIGLTEDRVRTMAESRLRAARLHTPEIVGNAASLYMSVIVLRNAYAYNVHIAKRRSDPFAGVTIPTILMGFPGIGTHGGDAGFIMQNLTERVDGLISDYLRVNGEYC